MKCVVPGANVKILARAIHSLAKIGDEMYVEPKQEGISFRTVNMAKSAYANFTFNENYFAYYTLGNLEQEDTLRCKITMRSVMGVFKAPSTMDRQVETCKIKLPQNASKLVFILKYKNGITKTHYLPIVDCEALQAFYTKDDVPNQLSSQAKVLSDAMQNFQQSLMEITMQVTPQKLLLRNYIDDTSDPSKVIRTQLVLGIGEFDKYSVGLETSITFCVKELRAVLTFAETVSLPVSVHFETAGRPVIFIIKNPSFEVNVLLSTLNPEADSQSETSTIRARESSVKKKASNKRATKRVIKPVNRRTINESNKIDLTANSAALRKVDEQRSKSQITESENSMDIDANDDLLLSGINDNVLDITNPAYHREVKLPGNSAGTTGEINRHEASSSCSSRISTNGKNTTRSIFSSILTKKRDSEGVNDSVEAMDADSVPNSPPRRPKKKARIIFQKCFDSTFDPRMLPGHDMVLAEDSDEQSE